MAALEEFAEDVNSEIVAEQPTDGEFEAETAGVDFPQESEDIDNDLAMITESAQGLEDIISLIDEAPGAPEAPLEPFVEKAVNVALESNDMAEAAGGAQKLLEDKSKKGVLEKVKAFAAKVWEMLRNFGKRIAQWVRETWARYTDRIVKNAAEAQKIIDQLKDLNTSTGAKIDDKGLLAKIATYKNVEVGEVLMAVSEHATDQGGKSAEILTKECRTCIDVVASGSSSAEGVMERFTDALAKAAGSYHEKATPAQAQAVKAGAGTETLLTKPFFGGYRAWVSYPDNWEALQYWNHGISKVDEVKPLNEVAAPNGEEIKAIAEYIVGLGQLVKIYQSNIGQLDALNKELDKAASKNRAAGEDSKQLKAMQAVVPRIIKGPQVAAYAYATSASTIALQYCQAAISAHRGDKSLGEKAGEAAAAAGNKVKGAFTKKGE
ncbi:hypothetical protein [Ralstonia phage RP31]|nr:hypothetical protein [Ralstonia phage RP31]